VALLFATTVAPASAHAQKRERDRITREELLASTYSELDLYGAIRSLRPHFLRQPQGARTFGGSVVRLVSVYVNGIRQTGVEALRTLNARDVDEITYLEPTRSENEYGPRANGGAIVVKLNRGGRDLHE